VQHARETRVADLSGCCTETKEIEQNHDRRHPVHKEAKFFGLSVPDGGMTEDPSREQEPTDDQAKTQPRAEAFTEEQPEPDYGDTSHVPPAEPEA